MPLVCDGCGGAASEFQCPLCQAEQKTESGFYCTQSCFATHWLNHRDTFHKRGVVRAKAPPTIDVELPAAPTAKTEKRQRKAAAQTTREAKKSRSETASGDSKEKPGTPPYCLPWPPLIAASKTSPLVRISPPLPLRCPRAVIAAPPSSSSSTTLWPAIVAAAQYIASSLAQDPQLHVLLVAGDALSAHAFAWAARCAGLSGSLKMTVSPDGLPEPPSSLFTPHRRVVVASVAVVREAIGMVGTPEAVSGAASLWLTEQGDLLVTLPDVADACDLQGVGTRGIFFVDQRLGDRMGGTAVGAASPSVSAWAADEELQYELSPLSVANEDGSQLTWGWPSMGSSGSAVPPSQDQDTQGTSEDGSSLRPVGTRFDNHVSTCLVNGDDLGALQHLVRLYSTTPGYVEEVLYNSLCCAWGAMSVAHAHHRLAYMIRYLVDHTDRFKSAKGASLADVVFRATVHVCRRLPPMTVAEDLKTTADTTLEAAVTRSGKEGTKAARTVSDVPETALRGPDTAPPTGEELRRYFNHFNRLPNLQLQATICVLFDKGAPHAALDNYAAAWGITHYLAGEKALESAQRGRQKAVLRVRSRYTAKMDAHTAHFLTVLMHLLYDAVAVYSLSVEEVERRLLWKLSLAPDVGPLEDYLANCFLLQPAAVEGTPEPDRKKKKAKGLSSRQTSRPRVLPRVAQLRQHPVRAASPEDYVTLTWQPFPITGKRARDMVRLQQHAVEEILMAMPREPRPMYIGDVGNLIGRWLSFNTRFDGALGVSLSEFLLQHPEAFHVVGNLVTRRKAGVGDQVKMRFDRDDGSDSDSDGDRKRRSSDRALLTGTRASSKARQAALTAELPARARKKRALKDFNKSRFNRNYKSTDPSARVPGYVKHAPRKIKGRGNKANKRTVKRG